MRILVTGASGRLGPYVVRELAESGHELRLFSRREPIEALRQWPWLQGDLNSFEDCLNATQGVDVIQHLGAEPSPSDHPALREQFAERGIPFDQTMRTNIMGLYYLLQAALRNDVDTFVMTGSNCALGHGYRISSRPFPFKTFPVDEAHPSDVEDAYSYSKLAGELLLDSYTRAYGLRTYSIRAAGICNEARRRDMARHVEPASGWNPWLWAWVGSEDVASAHRLLMEMASTIEPHGVYFCNADDTTALEPSLELIQRHRPEHLDLVQDLPGHASFLSNQRLKDVTGWQHLTSWREYL